MATRPGEENVATLFGDIHYFYGPETDDPPHHRFNKGSYVYLFENAQEGRARIEIANHPGTERQDAFDGFLDATAVTYSYKHSCMVSLVVIAAPPNQDEWHLPTYDPSNQNIYHYQLHAVDIYFWTHLDALKFVNGVRRLLPTNQVDIRDEPAVPAPPPPPQPKHYPAPTSDTNGNNSAGPVSGPGGNNGLAHVVQKLETVAINGGPAGSTPAPRSGPVPAAELSFAGPPTSAASDERGGSTSPPQRQQQQPAPAAFAYNPAAPAAPETIRPREKTPPPDDVVAQNPLQQRLYQDAATPFSPGLVVPAGLGPLSPGIPPPSLHASPGAPSFPAPPAYTSTAPTPAGVPQQQQQPQQQQAQHPGLVRAATLPVTSPSPFNPAASFPAFSPPPTTATAPPPSTTTAGVGGGAASAGTPAALYQAPSEAGFSNYNYGKAGGSAAGTTDFSIHQQMYRPTHGEAVSHTPKQDPRGKLEETAGRIEKGMTGMLKKFEKRFG
ncbi:RNA recognition motif-containing protein [Sporothrix schenckii 1099-18]|uniref:RNA recognition motif-containing protein n=2 Tax=Sporothrix schenckii TaxID=29908 RepID=U7Q284_SPOS1|nr:RNA recognition motif-containing protein [Sporothrix schenckii 1099-18]ERT01994.1 hypothetical protein HMPREF1624_00289 [Sporothrix schenckii ATCC 58251]KJR80831.1 RNA recognition motif-containing protein [Sporothrix schenckii 1099-18]